MSTGNTGPKPRVSLVNIQYLRAIAALLVVWVHAREQFPLVHQLFPSSAGGHGVDLFFVISGFIMVYTTHGKSVSPGEFLLKRFLRIAPLYWLITLFIVSVALAAPSLLKSTIVNTPFVLASLAFIPSPSPAFPQHFWPVLVPGWTLNYEMAFYVLFAATLFAKHSWRTPLLCVILVAAVALGQIVQATGVLEFYTDAIVLSFGAGAVLGQLYCTGRLQHLGGMLGWIAVLGGAAFWYFAQSWNLPHRFFAGGVPGLLLVLGACGIPPLRKWWLVWLERLGDATYSIYLTHILTLAALRLCWNRLGLPMSTAQDACLFIAVALSSSALAGWLTYRFVESPMHTYLTRRTAA